MSSLDPLVFELHTDVAGGKPGLIGSYSTKDNPTFQALKAAYGEYTPNYSRDFRGGNLGAPRHGMSILELQGSPGEGFTPQQVDDAANKLYNTFMGVEGIKSGNRPIHLFAGHGDVTRGETGAPGEKAFIKAVKARMAELSKNNSNFHYHYNTGEHIEKGSDPRSNWSRGAAILSNWNGGDSSTPARITAPLQSGDESSSAFVGTPSQSDAIERAQKYSEMSKSQMNSAYDEMRSSDPEKARIEGMKMHKAFFGK